MIAIIDYGAGNLHSVKNSLEYIGADWIITGDPKIIKKADHVILPGVGAFGNAMNCMQENGLIDAVKDVALSGKPFLGICLGLHLLFEESEESPDVQGLGIFKGKIRRIPDCGLKIPHMGWNSIECAKDSRILSHDNPFVYFVHSYYVDPKDKDIISSYTEYGKRLPVSIEKDNIFAVQFHPEKSGEAGLQILRKFISL